MLSLEKEATFRQIYESQIEDVKNGKPDPEIYLRVAKKLGVKLEQCLVFEDSKAGIRSAKAAQMKVIIVTTNKMTKKFNDGDCIINDFTEIDLG